MKKLLFLLALVFTFCNAQAQWNNEGNDGVPPLNVFDLDSFLLTFNSYGIYKSTNNGENWIRIESVPAIIFTDLEIINSKLIASTSDGIYISNDFGNSWTESNNGLVGVGITFIGNNNLVILPNNVILFSSGDNGLFKSLDEGITWTSLTGSPTFVRSVIFDSISNILACATQIGIHVSNDLGLSWNIQNSGLTSTNLIILENLNGNWFCAPNIGGNIFVSTNNSFQWSLANGLTGTYMNPRIVKANNQILANRTTGVHSFNFNSSIFENSILNQTFPKCIASGINQVFFGGKIISNKPDYFNSVFSTDYGLNWNYVKGIRNSSVLGFSEFGNLYLFFDGGGAGCYSNTIDSAFYLIGAPYVFGSISANLTNSLKYQNQKFYAATNSGIWISNDSAQTWVQYLSGLPATQPGNYHYIYDIEVFGDTIIAGTPSGPYISTNGGNSFFISNFPGATTSYDLLYHNGKLYSGGSPKMLVSADLGANWSQFGSTTDVFQQMAASGPYIYSASDQSIYLTIDSIGTTTNITGNLDPFIGIGNNPGIAAYDTLLFVSNFFRVGVHKMNINQPGIYTDVSDNLPVYEESPGFYQYPYLSFAGRMAIFDNKLWLGTAGMSCFTRPLSDFGYPPVVVTDDNRVKKSETENTLKIYPNPATQQIKISGIMDNSLLQIYGLQGELIQNIQTLGNTQMWIDVSHFAKGIYFVKVSDAKGKQLKGKFVKE